MKEYVSLKVAELLKEKGFDWELRTYYNEDGDELTLHDDFADISNSEIDTCDTDYIDYLDIHCTRPTQQMACSWLREEKGLNVEVLTCPSCYIWRIMERRLKNDNGLYSIREVDCGLQDTFEKYEDAVEAALKYSLTKLV